MSMSLQLEGLTSMLCPSCQGQLMVRLGHDAVKVDRHGHTTEPVRNFRCPLCGAVFPVGFILEPLDRPLAGSWPLKTIADLRRTTPDSSGGSSQDTATSSQGKSRAPGNLRANTMNPNNSAFRAAANNRSNQLNPNNTAFRSSRGKR